MKPKWSIVVGSFLYKENLSLPRAFEIAESLGEEVLRVDIKRQTSIMEKLYAAS
jgi:hypothetical protein